MTVYGLHFKGLWHDPPTMEDVEVFESVEDARAAFAFRLEFEWMPSETSEMHLYRGKECIGEPFLILYGETGEDEAMVVDSRRRYNTQVLRDLQSKVRGALIKAPEISDEDNKILTAFINRFYEENPSQRTLLFTNEIINEIQGVLIKYLE